MSVDVIVGNQRGDEGKGRFVDLMMPEYDIGVRYNGGNNAGHTVVADDGTVYKLHGLPTSIVHEHAMSVVGNGTVINPVHLVGEMATLMGQGIDIGVNNLLISGSAHLILPSYIRADEKREKGAGAQGSTKSGISEAYAAKANRVGVRAEIINHDPTHLLDIAYERLRAQRSWLGRVSGFRKNQDMDMAKEFVDAAKKLGPFVTDTALFLNRALRRDIAARVLAEAAQAYLLDLDHGMYPFTTSSTTTVAGVGAGLGIPVSFIDQITGITKAVQSHVGGGPFVTEITDPELLAQLHGDMTQVDAERGTKTNRVRRLGYLDLPQIRRAQMVNGQQIEQTMALTKLDWVPRYGEKVQICVAYMRKGKVLEIAPDAGYKLDESGPIYESIPTWKEDISGIRQYDALPTEAKDYVEFLETQTGVRVSMIGVGPRREQVIIR